MAAMSNEKRRELRIPADLWIEVERAGELYFQRASNLSVGGAFFTQTIPLPVGTAVSLKFTLPGATAETQCAGEIVNAKDFGMGVRFLELPEAARAQLEALISKAAPT